MTTHVIRQQYLHVEMAGTEADGLVLQRRLTSLCAHWLTPAIEDVLNRSASPHDHLCIERLEIDIGSMTTNRLEQDLTYAVAQALEKWLREHAPPGYLTTNISPNIRNKTKQHSINEAFIYFLKTGGLPWSLKLPEGSTLEKVILNSWEEAKRSDLHPEATQSGLNSKATQSDLHPEDAIIRQVLRDAQVRKRLVRQFSPLFLETLLKRLAPTEAKKMSDGVNGIFEGRRLWEAEFFRLALFSPAAQGQNRSMTEETSGSWHVEGPTAEEGIYIENAGLALLHPFLPKFFVVLGIADKDKLLQPERALCLLHYLTTGQTIAPEYELILPKILCNIPLKASVEANVELTTTEQQEALALLKAVIQHWDALRNTSPDGLRGTFLVRSGKVSLRDGDWLLQVESKSWDILLDRLPWGIGMIKLPWMERMLWVEWRQWCG
jgi:hypothetical protein